jgi:hypothetical protein
MKSQKHITKVLQVAFLITVMTTLFLTSFGQVKDRNLLYGEWKFVKFELPKEMQADTKVLSEANEKFKDVVYIFTKDNEFLMRKNDGSKEFNKQTTYEYTADNKFVKLAVGQTMRIDYIDNNTLRISVEGFDPIGIFERIKNRN